MHVCLQLATGTIGGMLRTFSPYRVLVFLYAVTTLAVVFFLSLYGFSTNAIIAVAAAFALIGGGLLVRHFLFDL
jgi:hypothetical protein